MAYGHGCSPAASAHPGELRGDEQPSPWDPQLRSGALRAPRRPHQGRHPVRTPQAGATAFSSPPAPQQAFPLPSALEEKQGLKKQSKKLPGTSLADHQIERWGRALPRAAGNLQPEARRQGEPVGWVWVQRCPVPETRALPRQPRPRPQRPSRPRGSSTALAGSLPAQDRQAHPGPSSRQTSSLSASKGSCPSRPLSKACISLGAPVWGPFQGGKKPPKTLWKSSSRPVATRQKPPDNWDVPSDPRPFRPSEEGLLTRRLLGQTLRRPRAGQPRPCSLPSQALLSLELAGQRKEEETLPLCMEEEADVPQDPAGWQTWSGCKLRP